MGKIRKPRSIRSTIVEIIFRLAKIKKLYSSEKETQQYLKKKAQQTKDYMPPKRILKKCSINKIKNMTYYTMAGKNDKVIIYLHGGAFVEQPLIFHWYFINKIRRKTKSSVIMPIYLLAPQNTYKKSYNLLLEFYKNVLKNTDSKNIVFMGDSAGGGMCLSLAQLLKEKELPQPSDIVMLSPCLDITFNNPDIEKYNKVDPLLDSKGIRSICASWIGNQDPNYYLLSPINGDLKGLGELTIFVGTHEILYPDALLLKEKCKSKNIHLNYYEYPKMNHVFPIYPIPEGEKARGQIIKIIKNSKN